MSLFFQITFPGGCHKSTEYDSCWMDPFFCVSYLLVKPFNCCLTLLNRSLFLFQTEDDHLEGEDSISEGTADSGVGFSSSQLQDQINERCHSKAYFICFVVLS